MRQNAIFNRIREMRVRAGMVFLALALTCCFAAAATERTWTGALSLDHLWSNPNNWDPTGIPQNGDDLYFPEIFSPASDFGINDLSGLSVRSLYFRREYVLRGNALRLSDFIKCGRGDKTVNASIECPLILDNDVTILVVWAADDLPEVVEVNDLYLSEPIDLNGHVLTLRADDPDFGSRTSAMHVSGGIIGTGDVIAEAEYAAVIDIRGSQNNSFTGKLVARTYGDSDSGGVFLYKEAGAFAANHLDVDFGRTYFLRPDQLPVSSTIEVGGDLRFLNNHQSAQTLVMKYDGVLDTGGANLSLYGNVIATNRFASAPKSNVKGTLSLSPGNHVFDIHGTNYQGLDIQARISGDAEITKTGNSALILSHSNSFTGSVIVNEGIVEARDGRAFGFAGSGVQLNGGAVAVRDVAVTAEPLSVTDSGSSLLAYGTCSWGGAITLNQSLTVYGEDFYIPGVIVGTGGLNLLGPAIELAGSLPNTFTGPTRVNCELLTLNKPPTGTAYAFSGPLVIGQDSFAPIQVRWFNDFQINRASASVTLYPNATMDLNSHNDTIGSLIFNGGTVQNGGAATLSLFQSVTANVASVTASINGGRLALASGQRIFAVEDGPNEPDLAVSSTVVDLGGITKNGQGNLRLSGANTFAGPVNIDAGRVHIQTDTALGTTGARTTVADGGTLQVEFVSALAEPLTIQGAGRGGTNGALNLLPGTGVQSGVVMAGPASVRVDSTFATLSGVVSGTGPFTKIGAGSLFLGGGGGNANTFTGATIVEAGTLVLHKPDFVPSVPGDLIIGSPNQSLFAPPASAIHYNHDQLRGEITVNRGGLLDLNNFDEEYGHHLTLNGGGDVRTGTGTLYLSGDVAVDPGNFTGSSLVSGRLGLRAGSHRFTVGSRTALAGGPELDLTARIFEAAPAAALVKEGSGRMRLGGTNSFTGTVNVNAGTLIGSNALAFGTSGAGTFVNNGAALALEGSFEYAAEPLTLNSTNPAAFIGLNGFNIWYGGITLQRTTGVHVPDPGAYLSLYGSCAGCSSFITGPGGLTKTGPGTLLIGGTMANQYAGLTTVNEGLLEAWRTQGKAIPGDVTVSGPNATLRTISSGASQALVALAAVKVENGGIWSMYPMDAETIRSLLGDGRLDIANTAALTVSNVVSCEFSGEITGAGALNKRGTATLSLTGNGPGFTGPATIFDGTIVVHGNLMNCPITVNNDAALRGDGVVGNVTAYDPNSVVLVDSSRPERQGGDLEVGNLLMNSGGVSEGVLGLGFYGPSPTGGNDSLICRGSVDVRSGKLSAGFLYPPREGDVVTLIRKDSAGAITGNFTGWPEGTTRKAGDVTVRATYLGGDGNDFTFTVTNLPAASAGYRLAQGNGNQTVEPDECSLLFLSLTNRRAAALTVTNALLRAVTTGVVVTIANASYPVIPGTGARENLTPFQFRTEPELPCGSSVELELVVGVQGEGVFAISFNLAGSNDCTHPTGGCQSCTVVESMVPTNAPVATKSLQFVGAPSICYPAKQCPGADPGVDGFPVPFITHSFTNATPNEVCLTAQLRLGCPDAPSNSLGAAAYLGEFRINQPCANYLGDTGMDGTQPFSFRLPAGSNCVILVSAHATNLVCDRYTLEVFGLPCPPPTLQLAAQAGPGQLVARWSSAYPDYQLQSVNTLDGPNPPQFNNVPGLPVLVDGKYTVSNTVVGPRQFFRLAR